MWALSRMLENPMLRQQLGVSADQAAKIRQQETDFEKTEIRNRADLQVKRLELNQLMSVDKPDRAAVDAKVAELGTAQAAMEKATIDNRLNMRDALTPVQRQRLEQIVAQRRQARFAGNTAFGPGTRGGGAPPAGRGGNRGAAPNILPRSPAIVIVIGPPRAAIGKSRLPHPRLRARLQSFTFKNVAL